MNVHGDRGPLEAKRLFDATGIDLEQVQVIGVEGDPDVEALARARIAAVKYQAQGWMTARMYEGRAPRIAVATCDFCRLPVPALGLRYKMVRFIGDAPLGGMACLTCYPLSKEQLREVVHGAKARR